MTRFAAAALAALTVATAARAHFIFVVPDKAGAKATVVLSEDLTPDEAVDVAKAAGLKLTVRPAAGGTDQPVTLTAGQHALAADLPGRGPRVVFGTVAYAVMQRGEGKPFLLAYHPKAVVGPVPADKAVVGSALPAELVPVAAGGSFRLKFLVGGNPAAAAEVTVVKPGGKTEKVKTGPDGMTPPVAGAGQFGAWAKTTEAKAGELNGKTYAEVRHYATLVFDTDPAPAATGAVAAFPPMPTAVSSFGAAACDGYLYVYGGHAGKTHSYDTKTVLGTFHRLKLAGGTAWEALPGGPGLQGMNLAAAGGKVYRVGGMTPRNAPGEPSDNVSVADCARFDPATKTWEPIASLPAGRSSHDVVAVGTKLVVVGGWEQKGKGDQPAWPDTALVLDLAAPAGKWETVPQPFKRRALTAAAVGSKVVVIAGMTSEAAAVRTVNVLDTATGRWTTGPDLPGADRIGFSPAAATVGGRVVVNTSAGPVYRLTADGTAWETVGQAAKKRMVARLVADGPDAALLMGGAAGGSNTGEVEVIRLPARGEKVSAAPAGR